jgi:transposase
MMGIKVREFAPLPDLSLEELVPKDNFYRRLEEELDLSFVRDLVRDFYAASGRPSVDPQVFFKLELVLFFEDLRSERQLMEVVADRLSLRWYLGYDLHEPLPDHSSLTRIRERYGLSVFRRFFEEIVEMCVDAGLVWGKELYFDSTTVEADAATGSLIPRLTVVREHLDELFDEEPEEDGEAVGEAVAPQADAALPTAADEELGAINAAREDWISTAGRRGAPAPTKPNPKKKGKLVVSRTDPDACLTGHNKAVSRLGYHAHYVVDGGKARVILSALVTRADIKDNQPMLDLLWRTTFRWKLRPRHVTGDSHYGTLQNIKAVEEAHIRAYMPIIDFTHRTKFFGKDKFTYDESKDLYICPNGEALRPQGKPIDGTMVRYRAPAKVCELCPLRERCTDNIQGRSLHRHVEEHYLDRVRTYHETEAYKKAMRKRKVWIEPAFGEAKQWHGMERMRLRMLERVNCEILITATGQNIKRLLTFGSRGPKRPAQVAALRPPERPSLHLGPRGLRDHRRSCARLSPRFSTRCPIMLRAIPPIIAFSPHCWLARNETF